MPDAGAYSSSAADDPPPLRAVASAPSPFPPVGDVVTGHDGAMQVWCPLCARHRMREDEPPTVLRNHLQDYHRVSNTSERDRLISDAMRPGHDDYCLDLLYGFVDPAGTFHPPLATPENGWKPHADYHAALQCGCEDGMCPSCDGVWKARRVAAGGTS